MGCNEFGKVFKGKCIRYEVVVCSWWWNKGVLTTQHDPIDQRPRTLLECKLIAAEYILKIINALNERFPDLPIFNATKLFNPKYYLTDEEDRTRVENVWLEMLIE